VLGTKHQFLRYARIEISHLQKQFRWLSEPLDFNTSQASNLAFSTEALRQVKFRTRHYLDCIFEEGFF